MFRLRDRERKEALHDARAPAGQSPIIFPIQRRHPQRVEHRGVRHPLEVTPHLPLAHTPPGRPHRRETRSPVSAAREERKLSLREENTHKRHRRDAPATPFVLLPLGSVSVSPFRLVVVIATTLPPLSAPVASANKGSLFVGAHVVVSETDRETRSETASPHSRPP